MPRKLGRGWAKKAWPKTRKAWPGWVFSRSSDASVDQSFLYPL